MKRYSIERKGVTGPKVWKAWAFAAFAGAVILTGPVEADTPPADLIHLTPLSGGVMSVIPAGPADLSLPGLHIVAVDAAPGEIVQVTQGQDDGWVSVPLVGGRAKLPFHPSTLGDLWSLRFRTASGDMASVTLVPDESLVLVPPPTEPRPPLRGLLVANWGTASRAKVRALDEKGKALPVLSVGGEALPCKGSWYDLGYVPSGFQVGLSVSIPGDDPAPVIVQVKTDDGRTASYALRTVTETLNTTPVSWPSETIGSGGWTAYTQLGAPIEDKSAANGDPSTGGTTPQQDTDITRGDSPYYPSALYAFDPVNQVFFYRIRVSSSPLTNGAQSGGTYTGGDPWDNVTWNLLIDTDGDGHKEFTVVLDGDSGGHVNSDISATPGVTDGDDLKVYYNNLPQQDVTGETVSSGQVTAPGDLVWWGNAGTHSATVPANPSNPADGATWDFGRSRCVYHSSSNGTWGAGWFVDFQFPISALMDAWNNGNGGRQLVGVNTPIAFGYSTSNSNSNPLQKDFASTYAYTASATARFPFSDVVTLATGITQFPQVGSMMLSNIVCPNQATVSTSVADALQVSPPDTGSGTVTDTIGSVTFQYYADLNGNGLPDDGSSWTNMATAGSSLNPDTSGDLAPDGITASFNDWGVVWNTSGLPSGQYLIKVIAVDDQGNTTTKTIGSYVVDSTGANCRVGINASWSSYSDPSHLVPSTLFLNSPPATVYMNGSFSPSTTYNVAYYDSTGALITYSAMTSDTFGTMLSSQLALTSTSPTGTYNSVVYPVSFTPPSTFNGTYNSTSNPLLADCAFIVAAPFPALLRYQWTTLQTSGALAPPDPAQVFPNDTLPLPPNTPSDPALPTNPQEVAQFQSGATFPHQSTDATDMTVQVVYYQLQGNTGNTLRVTKGTDASGNPIVQITY